jgi:putative ABC transport system ATP-binding protein
MELLEIKNLKKSFTSPDEQLHLVVDIPAFSLKAGEQVALEGGSGTGKTTFLNLIAGILKADEGEIFVAGDAMHGDNESQRDQLRAKHIGYVFQTFNLIQGLTALQNVELGMMFGNVVDEKRASSLLERVGLGHRLNFLPRQMSVGQQQRVAVARAMANHPPLILADEPTGNLDSKNSQQSLSLIRDLCRENGAALLLVSHDAHVLQLFDRVLRLAELNLAARERAVVS